VDKILDLSRLEAKSVPMEREWYQITNLIDDALQRRRSLLVHHPIELDLDPGLPALLVDGREIEVVLVNLIENAAKYSGEGTAIRISVAQREGQAILSVADQGIGIAPEHQDRIFERFYRIPRAGRQSPGTGLGLAICKRIVEAHGGHIWVESESGLGSCFHVSLPIDEPA
jgi:signal transduction histidine kinase